MIRTIAVGMRSCFCLFRKCRPIVLVATVGLQLSCGGGGSSPASESLSPLSDDAPSFAEDPVLYLDQLGGKHLYLPTDDGKVLVSESQTPEGNFFTTHYLPRNTDTSVEIQFNQSGLINRIQRGSEQLNIRYLGEDAFLIDGVDSGGNPFSETILIPSATQGAGLDSQLFEAASPKVSSRDRRDIRAVGVPYSLALQCEDGSILTGARLRMNDISIRNTAPAFSVDALLGLQASNAAYPINVQQIEVNKWQYYVVETTIDEAINLEDMNSGLNNACAFQSLISTGLALFGISFDVLDFVGVICNIRTALSTYSLAVNRGIAGVLGNDSSVRVEVYLPGNINATRSFRFTPRETGPSANYRLDWANDQYCISDQEIEPTGPLVVYQLPPGALTDDQPDPPEPDPEVEPPAPPEPDPEVAPPGNVINGAQFSVIGTWAKCSPAANGRSTSATQVTYTENGEFRESNYIFAGDNCVSDLFAQYTWTGRYTLGPYFTSRDGLTAREVDYALESVRSTATLFPDQVLDRECDENVIPDIVSRVSDKLYSGLTLFSAADASFVHNAEDLCRFGVSSISGPRRPDSLDLAETELQICTLGDNSASGRTECEL